MSTNKSLTERSFNPSVSGSLESLVRSLRSWGDRLLTLVLLEGKKAGISLAFMAGLGVAAGVLLVTGWLALVACTVVVLVQHEILGWPAALMIAALMSFASASGLALLAMRRSKDLLFPVSRRQLGLSSENERKSHDQVD